VFEGVPADYLGFFATEISKSEKAVALLAAADGGHLVFAQHPSAGKDMSAVLKQVLEKVGGKGGGTRDFARGKLAEQGHAQQALDAALSLL
jgi:alanyl-tRNA synthetase